jgi:hypothetical protein
MWCEATLGGAAGVDKEGVAVSSYVWEMGVAIDEEMVAFRVDSLGDSLDKVSRRAPAVHYPDAAAEYLSFSQFGDARGEAAIVAIAKRAEEGFSMEKRVVELRRDEIPCVNDQIGIVNGRFQGGRQRLARFEVGV